MATEVQVNRASAGHDSAVNFVNGVNTSWTSSLQTANRNVSVVGETDTGIFLNAYGLHAATSCPFFNGTAFTPTDGTIHFSAVGLHAGALVSNLTVIQGTAAAGNTSIFLGLLAKDGSAVLATSADTKATFTTGTKSITVAMTTPYRVPTSDVYLASLLIVAGTIGTYNTSHNVISRAINSIFTHGACGTSQTALATGTPVANANGPWIGVS